MEFDFSGFATKANLECSDGLTIKENAFLHQAGAKVPLVWQHGKNDPENVLGHAILEDRDGSTYARCRFNKSPRAQHMKEAVEHGDITQMSIHANGVRKRGKDVLHGMIREVSLVIAGANPGALIDWVAVQHADDSYERLDDEAVIYTGLDITIEHADGDDDDDEDGETVADVLNTLSDKQKDAVAALLGEALESVDHSDDDDDDDEDDEDDLDQDDNDKDGTSMTHNIFDQDPAKKVEGTTLTHSQVGTIVSDAEHKFKSLKDSVLTHANEYGITNIELLFPEAKMQGSQQPDWIKRRTEWVAGVLGGCHKSPFSRVKTMFADITFDTARANGYIKGDLKKEEFFALQGRSTGPQTIYKKQKLDRDDIVDITSFDVVVWIKGEMRLMLEEEIARAILIGDGRTAGDPDKIKDPSGEDGIGIRSIANDDNFYAHRVDVPANTRGGQLVETVLRSHKHYRGAGGVTFYTTEDYLTDMLLERDKIGRRLYRTVDELATEMRVSRIVPVEVMESHVNGDGNGLVGIMVNLSNYTIGADKGGETTFFDDFDIDFNQYKYLYETRISGALTKFKSAVVFWRGEGTEVNPTNPSFDSETNTITIPSVAGVVYTIDGDTVTGSVVIDEDTMVEAEADENYYFSVGAVKSWVFEYTE